MSALSFATAARRAAARGFDSFTARHGMQLMSRGGGRDLTLVILSSLRGEELDEVLAMLETYIELVLAKLDEEREAMRDEACGDDEILFTVEGNLELWERALRSFSLDRSEEVATLWRKQTTAA